MKLWEHWPEYAKEGEDNHQTDIQVKYDLYYVNTCWMHEKQMFKIFCYNLLLKGTSNTFIGMN